MTTNMHRSSCDSINKILVKFRVSTWLICLTTLLTDLMFWYNKQIYKQIYFGNSAGTAEEKEFITSWCTICWYFTTKLLYNVTVLVGSVCNFSSKWTKTELWYISTVLLVLVFDWIFQIQFYCSEVMQVLANKTKGFSHIMFVWFCQSLFRWII